MAGWTETSFTSVPVDDLDAAPYLVTVFVNGIPSRSLLVPIGLRPD
jgi:hypothetical protein